MTRPYERWAALWNFFMVLDQDWWDEYADEEAAIAAEVAGASPERLHTALREWHEAFDRTDDQALKDVVLDFNTAYEPEAAFGSYRGWAEWVREHIERELARRG